MCEGVGGVHRLAVEVIVITRWPHPGRRQAAPAGTKDRDKGLASVPTGWVDREMVPKLLVPQNLAHRLWP